MSLEGWQNSPFLRLRVGRVTKVYLDTDDNPDDSVADKNRLLGSADIDWLDWEGGRIRVPLTYGAFSNPSVESNSTTLVGFGYGDIHGPSEGDIVLIGFRSPTNAVIVGFLPSNYYQQTSDSSGKTDGFGTMRRVKRGEFSRKSKQQAEIYQDRAGAVQIIVKSQPVADSADSDTEDGSDATKATDINKKRVPSEELARVIIGEAYTNDDLNVRVKSSQDKPVVLEVRMTKSGASIKIDSDGNIDLSAKSGKLLVLNSGTKGVTRLDDEVKSTSTEDSTFFTFLKKLVDGLITSSVTPLDGGASYKAGIIAKLAEAGVTSADTVPQSITGKVTQSSSTIKAG